MTTLAVPAVSAADMGTARHRQVTAAGRHDWRLRDVEFADGIQVRRFECDGCGAVNYL